MTALFLLLTTFALGAEPVEASVADQVTASLAARHDTGCASIFALGDAAVVRDALVDATTHEAPPWAPLRAASCLTELAVTDGVALSAVRELIDVPGKPGFALAVSQRLDVLDPAQAEQLGKLALARADREPRLARRIVPVMERSAHDAVRALVPVSVETD